MKIHPTLLLLFFFTIPLTNLKAQSDNLTDSPIKKWIGEWEAIYTKTEPEGLLGTPGFTDKIYSSVVPTEDGKGVIWTNRWQVNGQEQVSVICVFYDPKSQTGHGISAGATGTVSYPEEGQEVILQSALNGLMNMETHNTWVSEDQVDTAVSIKQKGQPEVKGWGSFYRRKG